MLQLYNKVTNTGSLIKNILAQTAIPNINIVEKGDLILAGNQYIYNKKLIECTVSGTVGTDAEYIPLADYTFGTFYPQFTEKFKSKTAFYDSETHEWLGRYLRAYSKLTGINLMPFYNCASENYIDRYIIMNDHFLEKNAAEYKTIKIPIKFNQTYTIAIDCATQTKIAPAFFNKNELLNVPNSGVGPANLSQILWKTKENFKTFYGLRFMHPVTVKVENINAKYRTKLQKYEKFLCLLIQLPKTNTSSITVLEGDYTTVRCFKQMDASIMSMLPNKVQNEMLLSNLSLLQMNDQHQHPFANVLIEYLLQNAITSADKTENNIERLQHMLPRGLFIFEDTRDIWTPELRYLIYQTSMTSKKTNKLDLNGFATKDTELFIQKYRN